MHWILHQRIRLNLQLQHWHDQPVCGNPDAALTDEHGVDPDQLLRVLYDNFGLLLQGKVRHVPGHEAAEADEAVV